MIKLAFTTYMLPQFLSFDESLTLAKVSGCAGIDFRTGHMYAHGVELERTLDERKVMRRKLEDHYLEVASLNTGYKFDSKIAEERRDNIEGAKKTCQLAADLGCDKVRVFGNDITYDNAQDCVAAVADAIGEIAGYASGLGVNVMLEMHGQFNYWGYVLDVMRQVNQPNVGILYNCDLRDLVNGSCIETFRRVEDHVMHIHMKDVTTGYPYVQLFEELLRIDYTGYLSAELKETSDPTRVMQLHNVAVRQMLEVARRNIALMG